MLSFTNARQRLSAWFHKPLDTMIFDSWNAIIDHYLCMPITHALHHFIHAAENSHTPECVLDRLEVVWVWLNKHPDPPEHEYLIIETQDSEDGNIRLFVLDRSVQKADRDPERPKGTTVKESKRPNTGGYQLLGGLTNFIQSSIFPSAVTSESSLSSMEEGSSTSTSTSTPTPTPTSYPPLSFLPQHSVTEALSLATVDALHAVSDSLEKDGKLPAFDRLSGESYILRHRYGSGKNARQIKPNNLKMFEFILLASVVHGFAPYYSRLKNNCYWFSNMMIDAIIELFGLDNSISPEDATRTTTYTPIDTHLASISGRWKGYKVSHTKPEELSAVIRKFKEAHTAVLSKVKIFSF